MCSCTSMILSCILCSSALWLMNINNGYLLCKAINVKRREFDPESSSSLVLLLSADDATRHHCISFPPQSSAFQQSLMCNEVAWSKRNPCDLRHLLMKTNALFEEISIVHHKLLHRPQCLIHNLICLPCWILIEAGLHTTLLPKVNIIVNLHWRSWWLQQVFCAISSIASLF